VKSDRSEPTVIPVANEELFTVREAMRALNLIIRQIEEGMIEKAVLTKGGKMVAVVCGLDQYDGA
jgi:hypothetical protein